MSRVARPAVSLAVVLGCVVGTMALGIALKAPCSAGSWGDGRQYTFLCYSDIVPLLGTEQLERPRTRAARGCRSSILARTVPGQNCDEYPVLTMYFMRVAAWISGGNCGAFYYVNAVMLVGCSVAIALFLYLDGRWATSLYFALAPTLLVYGTMNWDLFAVLVRHGGAVLPAAASGRALGGRRSGWARRRSSTRACSSFRFIAHRLRERRPDAAITLGWTTIGAWFVVNLPFMVASPASWSRFFTFNGQRPADFDSLWYIGCRHVDAACLSTRTIDVGSAALFGVALALVWWLKARRWPDFPRWTLGLPLLVLFLLTNKVYSPQYGLWLLPWFAVALPGLRRFIAFEIADVAVFMTRFWFFGKMAGRFGVPQAWFEAMVLLRAAILVWCVIAWVRQEHQVLPIELAPEARRLDDVGRHVATADRDAVSANAGSTPAEEAVQLRDGLRTCLMVFLAVRIAFSLLSVVGVGIIQPRPLPGSGDQLPAVSTWPIAPISVGWHNVVTASERQDAARFLGIATAGYGRDDASAAFFPGYPLAIRAVTLLPFIGPLGAALLVSNLSFAVALLLLYGLTRLEFGSTSMARRSVMFLAVFPTAIFFLAPYSESLFLALSLWSFWAARRDRWGWAARRRGAGRVHQGDRHPPPARPGDRSDPSVAGRRAGAATAPGRRGRHRHRTGRLPRVLGHALPRRRGAAGRTAHVEAQPRSSLGHPGERVAVHMAIPVLLALRSSSWWASSSSPSWPVSGGSDPRT